MHIELDFASNHLSQALGSAAAMARVVGVLALDANERRACAVVSWRTAWPAGGRCVSPRGLALPVVRGREAKPTL